MDGSIKNININFSFEGLFKILVFGIVIYVAYLLSELLLLILFSLILASAIEPVKNALAKIKLPAPVAVLLVYLVFFGLITLFVTLFIPIISTQSVQFFESLPKLVEGLQVFINTSFISEIIGIVDLSGFQGQIVEFGKTAIGSLSSAVVKLFGGIFSFLLVLLLTFFFSVQEKGVTEFIKLISPRKYKVYVPDLWTRSKKKIGLWIQGQIILALIVGVLVYFGMLFLGVPNALFLALFAALMELIPVIGPIVSMIPATLIALAETNLTITLFVVLWFILLQQFENNLIYPLIVTKVVGVPAILVILALITGGILGGILGIIIAIPVVAAMIEFFKDLETGRLKEMTEGN